MYISIYIHNMLAYVYRYVCMYTMKRFGVWGSGVDTIWVMIMVVIAPSI